MMKVIARRNQIREKAQTLFRERGYAATSMRDLADALGIEAASLYNHVASKEEILQEICFRMAEEFFSAIEPIVESGLGPKEKLRAATEAHLGVIAANADASAVFLHEWRHMGEPFLSDFKLMRRRYELLFRKMIEEGIHKGVFRKIDAAIAARTLLSATNWTFESHKSFKSLGKLSPSEISGQITTILIEGIITR
jgi:TetR/AcrR family transcriptional regulator, cholesterol catabolism regulator